MVNVFLCFSFAAHIFLNVFFFNYMQMLQMEATVAVRELFAVTVASIQNSCMQLKKVEVQVKHVMKKKKKSVNYNECRNYFQSYLKQVLFFGKLMPLEPCNP